MADTNAAGFDLKTAVKLFFDRPEIEKRIGLAEVRALRAIGSQVRLEARDLLVKRKGPSKPGDPPHVHSTDKKYTLRFILYFYEPEAHTVVVGPIGLTRRPAPELLEKGGTRTFTEAQVRGQWIPAKLARSDAAFDEYPKRERTITVEPRPWMVRALEEALPGIPEEFRGRVQGGG